MGLQTANLTKKYFPGQSFRCSTFPLQPAGRITRGLGKCEHSVAFGGSMGSGAVAREEAACV